MKSDDEYVSEMLQRERDETQRVQQLTNDEKELLLEQIQKEEIEPGYKYFSKKLGCNIPLWKAYWIASDGYLLKECYISSTGDLYEMRKVESRTREGMDITIIPAPPETERNFGERMQQHREWTARTSKPLAVVASKPKWWQVLRMYSN